MLNIRGAGRQMEIGARSRIQDYRSPHGQHRPAGMPEFRSSEDESGGVQLDTMELMDGVLPELRTVDVRDEDVVRRREEEGRVLAKEEREEERREDRTDVRGRADV